MNTSNCCGSHVYDGTDICMQCGEHCEVILDFKTKMINQANALLGVNAFLRNDNVVIELKEVDDLAYDDDEVEDAIATILYAVSQNEKDPIQY